MDCAASRNTPKRARRLTIVATATVLVGGLAMVGLPWLLAYTALHPFSRSTGETPANYGLPFQEISFVTHDGLTLRGWHIPGCNDAIVIFVHGFARDRTELLPEAVWLVEQGYGALLFDTRAQGASDGAHISFGFHEALDVQAAVDRVIQRSPGEKIGVMGYSMGAVAAIRAAAQDEHIRAVIAVSPFADFRDVVNQRLAYLRPLAPLVVWWGERMSGLHLDDLRPVDEVAALSPRPILIMQAEADALLPLDSGQRLYAAAGEPKELWSAPGVGHANFRQAAPQAYRRRVLDFFSRFLLTNR